MRIRIEFIDGRHTEFRFGGTIEETTNFVVLKDSNGIEQWYPVRQIKNISIDRSNYDPDKRL